MIFPTYFLQLKVFVESILIFFTIFPILLNMLTHLIIENKFSSLATTPSPQILGILVAAENESLTTKNCRSLMKIKMQIMLQTDLLKDKHRLKIVCCIVDLYSVNFSVNYAISRMDFFCMCICVILKIPSSFSRYPAWKHLAEPPSSRCPVKLN